jgi:CRISPR-associated protein Csb2
MADFRELRGGTAGRLEVARSTIYRDDDPLFAARQSWESVTDYEPTRYRKGVTPEEALIGDLRSEVQRLGIAKPTRIEVIETRQGPRGGLAGRLRLNFENAVSGPILIGRTRHLGGGLFA